MKVFSSLTIVFLITGIAAANGSSTNSSISPDQNVGAPTNLMVDNLVEPYAVDVGHPTFMWVMNSTVRGDCQTAYRIIVSSSKHNASRSIGDIWDSGKIGSSQESHIRYKGTPLKSERIYYWKVRTWNKNGVRSEWSRISMFATGMLKISVWQGNFIGRGGYQLYRKEFVSDPGKQIQYALLYIGSWGVTVVYLNGRKVGDIVLNTADGVMRKTTWYRGLDVTDMIRRGRNAVGVMMGSGLLGKKYGDPSDIRFILNLVIRYRDGSSVTIASDGTWRTTKDGPLIPGDLNNVMDGEKYDARKLQEQKGWTRPYFNDGEWKIGSEVLNISEPQNTLKSQLTPPMKVVETYTPKSINEVFPGIYTVDAGKNITGWVQLIVAGDPGDKIDLRYAETLSTLWNNYTYSFTLNIVSHSAGVLFRAADEDNYYCWKFEPGKLLAYKRVDGTLSLINETPFDFKLNTDYRIRIETNGDAIKTYCNGQLVNSLHDNTFASGKVGFYEADSHTAIFSNINVAHGDSVLLVSDGRNPDLWLHNHNVRIDSNRLEVANSNYLISRFGNVNGGIDQSSLSVPSFVPNAMGSGAREHDIYIHGYDATEIWEPFQTLHGFRYVQVKGFKGKLTKRNIEIRVVRQVIQQKGEQTGMFSCSNELLNKLYSMSLRSYKNNLQWGIPTDCTGRDERNGWAGDAEQQSQEGYYYTNMTGFYNQWLIDMRETQHGDGYIDNINPRQGARAGSIEEDIPWSSAAINVPCDMYMATGEKSIIEKQYDSMKRFIDWCVATSNLSKGRGRHKDYTSDKDCWGDWGSILQTKSCCPMTMPQKSLYATVFWYHSVVRFSVLADSIGKTAESKKLRRLASKIRASYNRKFLRETKTGNYYYLSDTETDNALSLAFGLCPSEQVKKEVLNHLVESFEKNNYKITMGVLGLYAIFDVLCRNGFTDVAYKMVTQTSYPSWGYWIKHGATTCWEFWNGRGSRDHGYLGGRVNAFLVKYLAGISPLEPGYKEIRIKPGVVGDLRNAEAKVFTVRGLVSSRWVRKSNTRFELDVTVPANAVARVYVPLLSLNLGEAIVRESNTVVFDNGTATSNRYVSYLGKKDGSLVFRVGSGKYEFRLTSR